MSAFGRIWETTELQNFSLWTIALCTICVWLTLLYFSVTLRKFKTNWIEFEQNKTKEIVLIKCTDAYESVWSLGLVWTHQCGRHHPANPQDNCRFLEPHRPPHSCSLEDKSLCGEKERRETFSGCQEIDQSFSCKFTLTDFWFFWFFLKPGSHVDNRADFAPIFPPEKSPDFKALKIIFWDNP